MFQKKYLKLFLILTLTLFFGMMANIQNGASNTILAAGIWRDVDGASVSASGEGNSQFASTNWTSNWYLSSDKTIKGGFQCDDLDITITGSGAKIEIWVEYHQRTSVYPERWTYLGTLKVTTFTSSWNGYYSGSGTTTLDLDAFYTYRMRVWAKAYGAAGASASCEWITNDDPKVGAVYA